MRAGCKNDAAKPPRNLRLSRKKNPLNHSNTVVIIIIIAFSAT